MQTFIDLVQRHEQAFYTFVHNVHSKGQGLFDSLMGWIELFLNYARVGLAEPLNLEILLPAPGAERDRIMAEVDAVAQYHYRLKVAHEEKIRRRFRQEAAGEEEAALLDSVMASLSLDDTAIGEAMEEGSEEEEEDEDEDEGQGEEEQLDDAEVTRSRRGSSHVQGAIRGKGTLVTPVDEKRSPFLLPQPLPDDHSAASSSSISGRTGKLLGKKDKDKESHLPLPPTPNPIPSREPTPRSRKRKQDKKVRELMEHPETKAIAELRPLFVEMVRFPPDARLPAQGSS